ncbi:hypothetical protein C5167_015146 [Papaver somniferum]|uniref:Uncharacterized protein n=1 Tax=Papaver somniferum TaxID=3469 RepID=A0A4Y7J639_PAPSO|nr:hypothetical protein C5167_015146 [Papaver somniferum]
MLSDIKCQGCFNMQNNCIQSLTNSGCMWKLSNCLVPTNWRLGVAIQRGVGAQLVARLPTTSSV